MNLLSLTIFEESLSNTPSYFASYLNTEYPLVLHNGQQYNWPMGSFMAEGLLNVDNSVGPGYSISMQEGSGWSTFWIDSNQDFSWEKTERIIHNIGGWGTTRSNSRNLIFFGKSDSHPYEPRNCW